VILETLLKAGAQVDSMDKTGRTSLMTAVMNRDVKCVKLLLENKADPNLEDKYKTDMLLIAVKNNDVDCVKLLLEYKANIDVHDRSGMNCFHVACQEKNFEILTVLLSFEHTSLNSVDNQGRSALHNAVANNDLKSVDALLNAGIDVNIQDQKDGDSALHVACKLNLIDLVQRLIKAKPQLSVWNLAKMTAVECAAERGHEEIVAMLEAEICVIQ
jgi:ankyrin repeat protein